MREQIKRRALKEQRNISAVTKLVGGEERMKVLSYSFVHSKSEHFRLHDDDEDCGLYRINIKKMAAETGLTKREVRKALSDYWSDMSARQKGKLQ
ncbi:hypothetical protein [Oceanicola sp. S124]|uniref:hypothetical protein n=1 Tax=Oceanicola sp. S124 TaxID=1042378 RepID=UPI000255A6B3|nr:hypothetical protein [Oceanicola sp. S124]